MEKEDIADLLEEKNNDLFKWLESQPIENWEKGPYGKWTVGQQILHLLKKLQRLNKALSYPRFFLKYKFGLCNRVPLDYKTLVTKYHQKLLDSPNKVNNLNKKLKKPLLKDRELLLTKLQIQSKKLQYKIRKISDVNLDTLLIPHPLMGKITVRENIMLAIYHTEHHTTILKNQY